MSGGRRGAARWMKKWTPALLGGALAVAMVADTTFLGSADTSAINAPSFSAAKYAEAAFPELADLITENAVDLADVANAIETDLAAAGAEFGTDVGSGKFSFQVLASGTVESADENFIVLSVPDMPAGSDVRIPLGAALNGAPIRDATGTIAFGDFADQTAFQSVANQLKLRIQTEVLAPLDVPSLVGSSITVVGAWSTGGPAGVYLIQPVSIEVTS